MKKFFKCPIRFPRTFMRRKYILLIAVIFSISCTACSGKEERPNNGTISKEAATEQGGDTEMDEKTDSLQIPEKLAQIPADYFTPAGEQGTLERLTYKTYESMSYQNKEKQLMCTCHMAILRTGSITCFI